MKIEVRLWIIIKPYSFFLAFSIPYFIPPCAEHLCMYDVIQSDIGDQDAEAGSLRNAKKVEQFSVSTLQRLLVDNAVFPHMIHLNPKTI